MSNLSLGLCGKLARSVGWITFAPLVSDLSTGTVICPLNNWGQVYKESYVAYVVVGTPKNIIIKTLIDIIIRK